MSNRFRPPNELRVCILAENASLQFGGEASLPLHYFSQLRARGIEAWLVVHSRTKEELQTLFPAERDRIYFLKDKWLDKLLCWIAARMPGRVADSIVATVMMMANQRLQCKIVRSLINQFGVNVVHQPVPVSPRAPSLIHSLGVPVIIGPMNGGMEYPPPFRTAESIVTRGIVRLGRGSANLINHLFPGKRYADVLLVANRRTRMALPSNVRGRTIEISEQGVDLGLFANRSEAPAGNKFIFVGRLVAWKRVDLALRALARVPDATLEIVGDGPMKGQWLKLAAELGVSERTSFLGWMTQRSCAMHMEQATALLLPSIYECGGAVILEAAAVGTPSIATDWGGPADYLDQTSGILVPPAAAESMIEGFAAAMRELMVNPSLRWRMALRAQQKIRDQFCWSHKVDEICKIYRQAQAERELSFDSAPAVAVY